MATKESKKDIHTWKPIYLGGKGRLHGVFKMNANGLAWRSNTGSTIITVVGTDLRSAEWIRLSKVFQIRLRVKGGVTHKFDGFKEQDGEFLKSFFSTKFSVEITDAVISTKGWNWGETEFTENHSTLVFKVGGENAFEIPLSEVLQASVAAKKGNEVSIKLHQDDTTAATLESLVEMRYHFGSDDTVLTKNQANKFVASVLQGADTTSASGKGIVSFERVPVLVPRGRYDVEMFGTFLEMHGTSVDYKIKYSSIVRLFQLPRPDRQNVMFVISLEPPIRQGQTSYQHVVMQFEESSEITPSVTIPKELENDPRMKLLEGISKGPQHKVIAKVFKILTDKKVTIPKSFSGRDGGKGMKCSLKANEGYLFPLDRSFFFVHKPTIHIRFEEIDNIDFCRVSEQNFDINMNLKNATNLQFKYMPREDYGNFLQFLTSKGISVAGETQAVGANTAMETEDSGEDGGRQRSRRQGVGNVREKVLQAMEIEGNLESESDDDDFGKGRDLSSDEDVASTEIDSVDSSEESFGGSQKKEKKAKKKDKKEKKDKKDKSDKKEKKEKKDKKEKKEKTEEIELKEEEDQTMKEEPEDS